MAGAEFNLNAHGGTVFSVLDKTDVPLIGHCPVYPLKVNC
jgi:hypothetical protein